MGSKPGGNSSDLWAEIVATENQQQKQQVEVIYRRRRRTQKTPQDVDLKQPSLSSRNGNRMSLAGEAANKRVSWNRSLSTRGRTSIAVGTCVVYQPQGKQARRKGKPALPKRSEELIEEVILSRTLNCLRECDGDVCNSCTTFIETIDLKVCQGSYDSALIKAWEDWDENNGSENDHPKEFPEKQCYVVFVLEHGGKDLESFILLNFDEARSLLVQVTAALAVAEAAYEFEHRDLHWGNILLRRNDSETLQFILEGKHMSARTFGLSISIIDFTLSRINTGEEILFLDLSSDPDLFNGPKGDRQSETYRKMKEVTDDCWDGSFPRTNVLWLLYLVDILLLKKSFERNSKNERDLRALKKRLDKYQSAKEAIFDPFFSELLIMACE
ncbi:hypothetical protein I3842_07G035500 [Carya illinoinensis]|uniref:non-specific serine/threonine protein kinase n=1 Tax=Carya illinoinensis TaxID=32201 RepID=A0A922EFU5_CARIL|nr:hypothetical protein I3842_07G035500 [Carya illinoinensis]